MSSKPRSIKSLGICVLGALAANAQAVQVDFSRKIDGKFFRGGIQIGTYTADLAYNTNPIDVKPHPIPGNEVDFPGFVSGYSPWPLYQDKFVLTMSYSLGPDAPDGFQNRTFTDSIPFLINDFVVFNDFEFHFSHPQDQFDIYARRLVAGDTQQVRFSFRQESGALGSTSLGDILMGDSEGIFDCDAPYSSCLYSGAPLGFPGGPLPIGSIDKVGAPVPVPEPGSLILFSLAGATLVFTGALRGRGKRRTAP